MLLRELSKPGKDGVWEISVTDTILVETREDGSGTQWGQQSADSALKEFEKKLNAQMKKGWKETDRSLSRRVFRHDAKPPGKFWIIWLDKDSVAVQYGKIHQRRSWGTYSGQMKTKQFPSREVALRGYEGMIADKLVEGYQEQYTRTTEYSHLGEELAKKKLATPKVDRKVKEIPAEENVAKVLGERPQSQVHTEVTHRIELEPADWFWVSWKPWKPVPLPAPSEFDREACLRRMNLLGKYKGEETIIALQIPLSMTPEEARFWFEIILRMDSNNSPRSLAKEISQENLKVLNSEKITNRLKRWKGYMGNVAPLLRCLVAMLPPNEVVELYLDLLSTGYSSSSASFYADALTRMVLVYLTETEIEELHNTVRAHLDPHLKAKPHSDPLLFHVAARLRCDKEISQIVQSWPDDIYEDGWRTGFYPEPTFLFALGSPDMIETEVRRVKMPFHINGPNLLRALLATTELRTLDLGRDAILKITNKESCEEMLEVYTKVKAPEAAMYMLELSQSAKSPRLANAWLQTEVGNAITGLIPVAAGQGKLADAALAYLRDKNREGHSALIAAAIKNVPAEIAAKIKERVLDRVEKVFPEFTSMDAPEWLTKAAKVAAGQKPLAGSNFVPVDKLPPLVVQEKQLNREQVAAVLLALQHAQPAEPNDLLAGLKQHAEPQSLDTFVWTLFEQWLAEGGPPKQKWAMRALGLLGSDAVALKLTPLIRAWPGESQHPRAVLGLECLRAIGTDTALMQLNGIAVKLKFKGLQNKAREFMEAIAGEKGLSSAQLEDRIVPDCDLDERGSRVFDFGPRQFRFVLGPEMKPMLKDADGKVKTDLPKPGAKDDARKANDAVTAWKFMKKQIKEVATIQAQRLEQAMVTGRHWLVADFETLLVKHPLMTNLVRLLLWGGYDNKCQIVATFRVTEDQTYADAKDEECTLKGIDAVGIVHPLQLSEDQKSAWGEIFSDYEIVPPFAQLGRLIFSFDKVELTSNEITRFSKVKIPAATLIFGLEKLGWARGSAMDNGQVNGHSKYFPSADLTAVVIMEEGFTVGYREGWTDQTISDIYFVPGQYQVTWGRGWGKQEIVIPLKTLDPVIASEILKDLSELAAKGK